jgi:hypothetical protein
VIIFAYFGSGDISNGCRVFALVKAGIIFYQLGGPVLSAETLEVIPKSQLLHTLSIIILDTTVPKTPFKHPQTMQLFFMTINPR